MFIGNKYSAMWSYSNLIAIESARVEDQDVSDIKILPEDHPCTEALGELEEKYRRDIDAILALAWDGDLGAAPEN